LLTQQLHAGIEAVALKFRASEMALTTELDKTESICRGDRTAAGDIASNDTSWDSLCPRLRETGAQYRRIVSLFQKELVGLEGVYRTESGTQDQIIGAAHGLK
jgi:hypothetical protein